MRALLLITLLGLTGCNELRQSDDRICLTPGTSDVVGGTNACIHKWAYRLSGAPGTTEEIANAVLTACNEAAMEEAKQYNSAPNYDQKYRELLRAGIEQARFRVIQSRAGHCAIP